MGMEKQDDMRPRALERDSSESGEGQILRHHHHHHHHQQQQQQQIYQRNNNPNQQDGLREHAPHASSARAEGIRRTASDATPGLAPEAHTPGLTNPAASSPSDPPPSSTSAGTPPTPHNPHHPPALQRPRACDSCRGLKVRCQPLDESNVYGTCKRCAKARRECIYTPPSRKRQKKTDTRVDELEKKIEALTASLQGGKGREAGSPTPSSDGEGEEEDGVKREDARASPRRSTSRAQSVGTLRAGESAQPILRKRSRGEYDDGESQEGGPARTAYQGGRGSPSPAVQHARGVNTPAAPPSTEPKKSTCADSLHSQPDPGEERSSADGEDYQDVVERGLISVEVATDIFNHYVSDMAPLFPAVVFPPETTMAEVRKTRPTVFLAIMAIASGQAGNELHMKLNKEVIDQLAVRVLCKGEKSLGLIQSLVLCSAWYYPPNEREELRFYQLVHMAAVMTMDIGINRRNGHLRRQAGGLGSMDVRTVPQNVPGTIWREHTVRNEVRQYPDASALESRRTLLACYYCCSAVAMGLRRQNIFRFTSYMGDCIDVLETSDEALASDRVLAQWCKVQRIAEDISVAFSFDDPGANVSIQDLSVQFTLKGFRRQLEDFRVGSLESGRYFKEGEVLDRSLKMAYNTTVLNAHEIALHVNHNVDEFGPPYTEKMIRGPTIQPNSLLTSFHIDLLSRCLTSVYAILDIFLSFSVEETRSLPIFHFVRTIYAAVILMKLFFSAAAPKSELGMVLDKDGLRVDVYVSGLVRKLDEAARGGRCRSAEKFGRIFMLLQSWWEAQRGGLAGGGGNGGKGGEGEAGKPQGESSGGGGGAGRQTNNAQGPPYSYGSSGVQRGSLDAPRTPDLSSTSSNRLPPLHFAAGTGSSVSEAPSTPPYTSSSVPTPSTEGGGYDGGGGGGAHTPIPISAVHNFRQKQSLPSLPPPSQSALAPPPTSFTPSTPLQILSDVASGSMGSGTPGGHGQGGKDVIMLPSVERGGQLQGGGAAVGHSHSHPHSPAMQAQMYPPYPTRQQDLHPHPPPPPQGSYFPLTTGAGAGAMGGGQYVVGGGMFPAGGAYQYSAASVSGMAGRGGGYVTSGGGMRGGGGGSGGGYYTQEGMEDEVGAGRGQGQGQPQGHGQGGLELGMGVDLNAQNWMADDLFWAVMDGLPGSLDGWGGGGMG